jgi:hypothetical protein
MRASNFSHFRQIKLGNSDQILLSRVSECIRFDSVFLSMHGHHPTTTRRNFQALLRVRRISKMKKAKLFQSWQQNIRLRVDAEDILHSIRILRAALPRYSSNYFQIARSLESKRAADDGISLFFTRVHFYPLEKCTIRPEGVPTLSEMNSDRNR